MTTSLWIRLALFGIASLGATFVLGCLRRFPLGFAAALSVGAYTAACLQIYTELPWVLCLPIGSLAGASVCLVPAVFDKVLQGDEYVVLSWMLATACAETIGLMRITGGQHSLIGIPPLFGGITGFQSSAWLLGALFGVSGVIAWLFRRSYAYQEALLAGVNPRALLAGGQSVQRISLQVHLVAGLFGGLAGAFWGSIYQTLHPSFFGLPESVVILLVCLLGGQGRPWGVPVGLLTVFVLPQMIHWELAVTPLAALSRSLGMVPPDPTAVVSSLQQALLGVLLVVTIIWLPQGIVPSLSTAWERHRGRH